MVRANTSIAERFEELTQKTHTEQAKWFLNGFWEGLGEEREMVWNLAHKFIEIESGEPVRYGRKMKEIVEGCDLNEFQSHKFLESLGETLTVKELRKRLEEFDIDNNKKMSISEYLLTKYNKTPKELVESPQGTVDKTELEAAEEQFRAATAALDRSLAEKEAAAEALAEAKKSAQAAAVAEQASEQAASELKQAVDDLHAQEQALADKIAALQAKIDDPKSGTVAKNRSKNEIEQIKSEDPLPLRKAKITQQAALKKAEKALAAATKARELAEQKEAASLEAKELAEQTAAAAEAAVAEAQEAFEKIKSGAGTPYGGLWWMERILEEKKKFM
jgi:DNA repair exonuclease SbcCD ATPase subunit